MANPRIPGTLAVTGKQESMEHGIQAYRGTSNLGLRSRPLGTGTIQVTAGTLSAGVNTITAVVNSVAISDVIDWGTSHDATAAALAVSINAFANGAGADHDYVATVTTDTVTVRQRSSGAIVGSLTATVGGDVTATVVDFANDTDTWTEHVGGATFDGDLYYELGFDSTLIYAGDFAARADIMLIDTRILVDGQAWEWYMNGIRANAAATALVQGVQVATATYELIEWLDAQAQLVIKVVSDEELLVKNRYI